MSPPQKQNFISTFKSLARLNHPYTVFQDFVTISAITLHNAVTKGETRDKREEEYMNIIKRYEKDDVYKLRDLFHITIDLLDDRPVDLLGQFYMELEIGNQNAGQFFTPPELSKMMAQMIYSDKIADLNEDFQFVRLSEPACGSGGMVLAFVEMLIQSNISPHEKLWCQCIDVDRTVALMCYVQLALWNVPAQIIVGNTLTLDFREQWFTPAHYLFHWGEKIRLKKMLDFMKQVESDFDPSQPKTKTEPENKNKIEIDPPPILDGEQLSIF